jgi:flagellar motility protein MotE (MotC chaperone)
MRRFHILPALAIFACLSMGADTREPPAKAPSASPSADKAPEKITVAAEPSAPPVLGRSNSPDPSLVRDWCSTEEKGAIELASALRSRSSAIDERERLLSLREEELKKSEQRIVDRLSDLKKLREQITQQLEQADTEKKTKVDELVKMVEANRPANISGMFEVLDEALAVQVLDRMNPGKAGKLLAVLTPAKAARLASKMTHPVTEQLAEATPAPAPPVAPVATPPATPAPPATPPATPPAK